MSGDDEIRIILEHSARLSGGPPPPGITPDQLATGTVPLSQLLRALGLAANGGDPRDMATLKPDMPNATQKSVTPWPNSLPMKQSPPAS